MFAAVLPRHEGRAYQSNKADSEKYFAFWIPSRLSLSASFLLCFVCLLSPLLFYLSFALFLFPVLLLLFFLGQVSHVMIVAWYHEKESNSNIKILLSISTSQQARFNRHSLYIKEALNMEKDKVKLEIYEDDPFGSTCCGPGPRVASLEAAEKLRRKLEKRSETVKKLSEEYKDSVTVSRDFINQKRSDYPEYVMKLMLDSKPTPYIFVDEEPVIVGKFPSYEEFTTLLKSSLRHEPKKDQ